MGSKQYRRMLKKDLLSCFFKSQIWINCIMANHHQEGSCSQIPQVSPLARITWTMIWDFSISQFLIICPTKLWFVFLLGFGWWLHICDLWNLYFNGVETGRFGNSYIIRISMLLGNGYLLEHVCHWAISFQALMNISWCSHGHSKPNKQDPILAPMSFCKRREGKVC